MRAPLQTMRSALPPAMMCGEVRDIVRDDLGDDNLRGVAGFGTQR